MIYGLGRRSFDWDWEAGLAPLCSNFPTHAVVTDFFCFILGKTKPKLSVQFIYNLLGVSNAGDKQHPTMPACM